MNTSNFFKKLMAWYASPKKYKIDFTVRFGEKYTFEQIEVEARHKHEAIHIATEQVFNTIKITATSVKSLGRINKFF